MIRFIHTADCHFGIENYGKIDPKTGIHSRLLDFEHALTLCIDKALEEQVDFFLFCGDAYKTANPSPTQQKLLLKCFFRLYNARIPSIILIGNHDNPLSFGKANSLDIFKELPLDGFHVLAKPTSLRLETKNGPIQIVGIPWPTRNTIALTNKHSFKSSSQLNTYITESVNAIIQHLSQELDPTIPSILAGHLTVSSGVFSGSEKRALYGNDPIFLPSQLAREPFAYIALGHLHRHQNLNPHGIPLVYAGSLERIDFGERNEDKGFCLVTIDDNKNASYSFIKIPTRPFIQIEVHLKPEINQTEQLITALEQHDIKDAIIKILYHIPPGKKDMVDLHKIHAACSNALHLVAIIPIRKPETREKRILTTNVNMDLTTLLTTYLETKDIPHETRERLIQKTLLLHEENIYSQETSS